MPRRDEAIIITNNIIKNGSPIEKRAFGCIAGSFIGDSIGKNIFRT